MSTDVGAIPTEDLLVAGSFLVGVVNREPMARRFPELKAFDAKSRGRRGRSGVAKGHALSLADVCALARAWEYELPALTGDGHWAEVARVGLPVVVLNYRAPKLTG